MENDEKGDKSPVESPEKMKQINSSLLEELERYERENANLRRQLEELVLKDDDDIRDAKILQLAKKNRSLTVQLNKEKGKVATLTKELEELMKKKNISKNQLKHYTTDSPGQKKDTSSTQNETDDQIEQIEQLEQLVKQYKHKEDKHRIRMQVLRDANAKLKNEISKMKLVLQQELGEENIDVEKLLKEKKWRGRAQQIVLLKSKVKKLEAELNEAKSSLSGNQSKNITPEQTTLSQSMVSKSHDYEERHRESLERIEAERKLQEREIKKQLEMKQQELLKSKRKTEALQARIKTLEQDNREIKAKIIKIIQKTENDDKLIQALKKELENKEKMIKEIKKSKTKEFNESELYLKVENQQKELQNKEELIKTLKEELQTMSQKALNTLQSSLKSQAIPESNTNIDPNTEIELKLKIYEIEVEKLRNAVSQKDCTIKSLTQDIKSKLEEIAQLKTQNGLLEKKILQLTNKPQVDYTSDEEIDLEDKLLLAQDENSALRKTLEANQSDKEKEMEFYQSIIDQQKQTFNQYIDKLKKELEQQGKTIPPLTPSVEEKKTDETLLQEIERLKNEVQEYKIRYNSIALKLQKYEK